MRALIFLLLQAPLFVFAFKKGDIDLHFGGGLSGTRGLAGASIERFVTDNQSVVAAISNDFAGVGGALGYRYFFDAYNTHDRNEWFGKCLFMFECDDHLYAGAQIQSFSGSEISITNGASSNVYTMDPRTFAMLVIGDRSHLMSEITIDIEFTYRTIAFGGGQKLKSGTASATDEPNSGAGFGFGIGIGYNF